ncbi:hypothetical protein GCM10010515_40670 [Streptomyces fructofermentans]|uniref:Uncharacterized protein n=1 Tax=Streptomyces fructofermentans TaxID=152141 RepID=A0A918NGH1_9ACTN|nr:hypothetical protein GCM10010515_40670 [Streptomyces fructofermentans]
MRAVRRTVRRGRGCGRVRGRERRFAADAGPVRGRFQGGFGAGAGPVRFRREAARAGVGTGRTAAPAPAVIRPW